MSDEFEDILKEDEEEDFDPKKLKHMSPLDEAEEEVAEDDEEDFDDDDSDDDDSDDDDKGVADIYEM